MTEIDSEFPDEERFRDLFDNAHDLIQLLDMEGKLLLVNKAWLKSTGYTNEEVIEKNIYDFVREEDKPFFINYRKDMIAGLPLPAEIIVGLRKKDGQILFMEGGGTLRKEKGKPLYTRGIFRDITLRLKNEARIKEREQYLQDLLMNAPDAVIVIDHESQILFWNPKAETLFGWSSEDVIGKALSQIIIPHQYREAHHLGMQRYLQTGEARVINKTIEITALNKNGYEFNVALTISRSNQNNKPVFIAFIRDITDKKKNEEELEKRSRQLESSNAQLLQFAHAASHDMKEPVRKILLYLGRIQMEHGNLLPPKVVEYLSKAENASNRLWNIVEGFLNYSSINTFDEENETIHLENIIKEIEKDLELIIEEKRAIIRYSLIPSFKGITFLIYQLFYNLILNALKFSKSDIPPEINITGEKSTLNPGAYSQEQPVIIVKVKDNGIGFRQENSEKIFKSFSRLNASSLYEGTGLGLALCKNIVERHGGSIIAEGILGEGAMFTVVLPV